MITLSAVETAIIEPIHQDSNKKEGLSLDTYLNLHEQSITVKKLQGLSNRTISDYLLNLQYFITWLKENETDYTNLYIDRRVFLSYTGYMIQKFKPATVNIRLRTAKCFLNWLYSEDYIKENMASKLKLVKVPQDTIKPLEPAEVKMIFKALNLSSYSHYRDFVIMLVILDCGARINEVVNIKIDDYDKKQKTLTIRSDTSKTRQERLLLISGKTSKLLERLISIAEAQEEEYIFCSSYGGRLDSLTAIKNFEKYGKKAGLNKRTTPHIFRHVFAVQMVKAGTDIFTLQRLLGHNNITTTRQYIQLDNRHLIESHTKANIISMFI